MEMIAIGQQFDVLWVTGLAAACGSAIGLERERSGKSAGLRTHMLVAAASAMATGLGVSIVADRGDPTRVLHGVLTGIGFLGSGVIFRDRKEPAGLTSSAVIMLTAMIGAACGLGAPVLAAGVTFFALATLWHVKRFEESVSARWAAPRYRQPLRSRVASVMAPTLDLRTERASVSRPDPRPRRREVHLGEQQAVGS